MASGNRSATIEKEYMARYPPTQSSRKAAVLLVTQSPGTAGTLSATLFRQGYAVIPVATLTGASDAVKNSYIEALVLDVNGVVPVGGEYRPDSEAVGFIQIVQRINRDLKVILIDSGRPASHTIPPAISDLIHLGAAGRQNGQGSRRPFDVADLVEGPYTEYSDFFEILRSTVGDMIRTQEATLQTVGRGINFTRPSFDQLSLTTGEAARKAYERNRLGGAGQYLKESINGVVVTVDPRKLYAGSDVTFHIKPVTLEEAIRTNETFQWLIGKNRDRHIPVPFGFYPVEDSGKAYQMLSFIIAANNSVMRQTLDPSNPEVSEHDREAAAGLWGAILHDLFNNEYPQWYADTHERVMADDHKRARDGTRQKQIEQMSLFSRHSADISGSTLPEGLQPDLESAIRNLYRELGPIKEQFFVLPMDPKAANIGRLTYQSMPPTQRLFELFTTGQAGNRQVNEENLGSTTFAHWDYKMLGTVDTIFADLWQALLDPAHRIPSKDTPVRLYETMTAIFPRSDFSEFLVESLRQGLYKASLKTYVQVAHAQVNEGRLARMKTLDYDDAVANRSLLQDEVEYFARRVLMFSSALYAAIAEEHTHPSEPFHVGLEKMIEHFSDESRWNEIPSSHGSQKPVLGALKTIHDGFSFILQEGLHQFNPEVLKRNYEQGKILRY